jgi:hypothetical protein
VKTAAATAGRSEKMIARSAPERLRPQAAVPARNPRSGDRKAISTELLLSLDTSVSEITSSRQCSTSRQHCRGRAFAPPAPSGAGNLPASLNGVPEHQSKLTLSIRDNLSSFGIFSSRN